MSVREVWRNARLEQALVRSHASCVKQIRTKEILRKNHSRIFFVVWYIAETLSFIKQAKTWDKGTRGAKGKGRLVRREVRGKIEHMGIFIQVVHETLLEDDAHRLFDPRLQVWPRCLRRHHRQLLRVELLTSSVVAFQVHRHCCCCRLLDVLLLRRMMREWKRNWRRRVHRRRVRCP